MKIGLFGDSYVDFRGNRGHHANFKQQQKIWSWQLINELSSVNNSSGHGGTDQYHAIEQWRNRVDQYDYAIFTFTWHNRLYLNPIRQEVSSAWAERRPINCEFLKNTDVDPESMYRSIELYYSNIHDENCSLFLYELMVKYCLELPMQHPSTQFIFLPNTEIARKISKKYFSKGVLVDFAFETLSNRETNSPGIMPCFDATRYSHLNEENNRVFKEYIKNIILNFNNYKDTIVEFDYNQFDIKQ